MRRAVRQLKVWAEAVKSPYPVAALLDARPLGAGAAAATGAGMAAATLGAAAAAAPRLAASRLAAGMCPIAYVFVHVRAVLLKRSL